MFIPVDIPSDNLAAVFRVLLTSLKLLQDAVEEIKQVGGWYLHNEWGGALPAVGWGPPPSPVHPAHATAS